MLVSLNLFNLGIVFFKERMYKNLNGSTLAILSIIPSVDRARVQEVAEYQVIFL